MSCDGGLAVSQGRFRNADGLVGSFITVWQQQRGGGYEWTYDLRQTDDPQPAPRPGAPPPSEEEIVVTAIDAVQGLVADCAAGGAPPLPPVELNTGIRSASTLSKDGTLRWRWEHGGPELRRVVVDYLANGSWQTVLDQQGLPAAS